MLDELGPRANRYPLPLRVSFHDSCHLQHAQRVRAQPRALLAAIPGLTLLEIPESAICCGSAGIYNLVEPKTANELADRKARLIAEESEGGLPDAVATGNVGCLLQLRAALERQGRRAARRQGWSERKARATEGCTPCNSWMLRSGIRLRR